MFAVPITDDPVFEQAVRNYPECELKRNLKNLKSTIKKDAPNDLSLLGSYRIMQSNPDNTKRYFVFMRFQNPICFWCSNRNRHQLQICDGCKLVHYCNDRCKKLDAHHHRVWCRQVPNVNKPRKDCPHLMKVIHSPNLPSSIPVGSLFRVESSQRTVFDYKQDRRCVRQWVRKIIKKVIADSLAFV